MNSFSHTGIRGRGRPRYIYRSTFSAKEKANLISQTGLYLMPATTYAPTHLARAVPSALRGLTSVFGMVALGSFLSFPAIRIPARKRPAWEESWIELLKANYVYEFVKRQINHWVLDSTRVGLTAVDRNHRR